MPYNGRKASSRQIIYAARLVSQIGTRAALPTTPRPAATYAEYSAFLSQLEATYRKVQNAHVAQ